MNKKGSKDDEELKIQNELIEGLKAQISELEHNLDIREGEILEKNDKIKNLNKEIDELKGVIFKLQDVRTVLNRVLGGYRHTGDALIEEMKEGDPAENIDANDGNPIIVRDNDNYEQSPEEDFWYAAKNDKIGKIKIIRLTSCS